MSWKFWFTWGIDKGESCIKPEIPDVLDVQPALIQLRKKKLRMELFERGKADLHIDGLLPESVQNILQDAVCKGYMVWKRVDDGISMGEYSISVQSSAYLEKYYQRALTET